MSPPGSVWGQYIPASARREHARREAAARRLLGHELAPVEIAGRRIASTFWGKAWCDNLERYSDFKSRLPRGRSYVRNGSVIDLQISAGQARALVLGKALYTVTIDIKSAEAARWAEIARECAGEIDSVIELLQGKLSGRVMEIVSRKGAGLFPAPADIAMKCSCPDWATMCKHVAAALYGVGARLDHRPELLFELRGVDPSELVTDAVTKNLLQKGKEGAKTKALKGADLSGVFGIDIEDDGEAEPAPPAARPPARKARAGAR